jgi:hypothetical protein
MYDNVIPSAFGNCFFNFPAITLQIMSCYIIVTCRVVHKTKITRYSSDDCIYYLLSYKFSLITLEESAIAGLHNFQSNVAHALTLSFLTSRLLATDLNTETSTSNHYEVFLLFRLHSLWYLGTKNYSGHSSSLRLTRNCPWTNSESQSHCYWRSVNQ